MARTTKSKKVRTNKVAKASPATQKKHESVVAEVVEDVKDVIAPHKMLRLRPVVFAAILIITGLIGLFASLELTVDKIKVLKDPNFSPICNINPVFSCESVMTSSQAEFMGMPNTVFGLIGFSMVIAIGAGILAGARFHRRFWQLWMLGMAGGLVMMLYLMFQSIYRLGTLCLFCIATWVSLTPLIWYSLLWALEHGYLPTPKKLERVVRFIRRDHLSVLILFYIVALTLIVNRFWYFFKTL